MQVQGIHLLLGDFDAFLVLAIHQASLNLEPGFRRSASDVIQHRLEGTQRLTSPIQADVAEQSVLDRIPLGRSGGVVTYHHVDTQPVCKLFLESLFP